MGAALTHYHPADRCATSVAWLPSTVIHAKVMLKAAAAIDPVDAGSIEPQTCAECAAETLPQRFYFGWRQ